MNTNELESFLRSKIPLAEAMALRVLTYDGQSLEIAAPLDANINHQGTAFGGSIASLGILASWGLLHLKILELGVPRTYLVIQRSEVDYIAAISSDLTARSALPTDGSWETFAERMQRRGKGRIVLSATVNSTTARAAAHRGTYVALQLPENGDD